MYATQTDLEEQLSQAELIELTDDAGAGAVDGTVIARAIADAEAEIDAFAGVRHPVPFPAPAPRLIRKLAVDMAIYHLFARRMAAAPEERKERHLAAIQLLKKLAAGTIRIGAGQTEGRPAASTPGERLYTRNTLKGY